MSAKPGPREDQCRAVAAAAAQRRQSEAIAISLKGPPPRGEATQAGEEQRGETGGEASASEAAHPASRGGATRSISCCATAPLTSLQDAQPLHRLAALILLHPPWRVEEGAKGVLRSRDGGAPEWSRRRRRGAEESRRMTLQGASKGVSFSSSLSLRKEVESRLIGPARRLSGDA